MARFTGTGGGGGAPGPRGPQGPAGDSAYDVAVENGFVGTEQEWLDSIGGSANIADFVFNYDAEATDSTMTIHNHDMVIQTTRDGSQDADITIDSADDVWINAQDEIEIISKTDDITIIANDDVNGQQWRFHTDGTLTGPAEGNSVKVNGIQGQDNSPLYLIGPQSVVISGDGGEFLHNADGPENQIATIGDINEALPQPLGETDSPSFDKVFVTNNDGTGMNVKFGDDAWIGDVNIANNVAVIGVQDPTVGGIIFGNGLTEKIVSDENGNLQLFMDGSAYIGNVANENRIATVGDIQETGTANFTFNENNMSTNEDMTIGVNGVPGTINLSAYAGINLQFAESQASAGLRFPDGSVQRTAFVPQSISPLPDFLTYVQGRAALPNLNQNFGWDARGLWFGPTAVDSQSNESYPVFTNFTLNTTDKVFVSFLVDVDENCSDVGISVFLDEVVPNWTWGTDTTRIAAQFDCPNAVIHGLTISSSQTTPSLPGNGTYRIEFTYDPTLEADNVKFEYFALNSNVAIGSQVLTEVLPSGNYRIGFASDNDIDEDGDLNSLLNRTYISDLFISVNNDQTTYSDTLQNGNSGGSADIADFVFDIVQQEGTESRMTIHNHDMVIRTTRDDNQDADIEINSADDIWMTAGDEIEITAVNDEVRIITGAFGQNIWNFRRDGIIGKDGDSGFESLDNGDVKGRLKFEPNNGRALLQAYSNNQTATFTSGWDTATWTAIDSQSQLTLTNASSIISFMEATGYQVDNLKISVNGSYYAPYNGASSGDGAITFYIQGLMPPEEFTLTQLQFQYAFSSKVDIDFDEGDLLIKTQDEMDIVLDAADDVRINANGSVDIWAADININSELAPSSLNINTYSGAVINSARTSSYAPEDRVVATLGDISSANTGDITFVDSTISNNTGDDIVIQNKNESGVVKSRIILDQSNEQVLIEAINGNTAEYTVADWGTATWSGTVIEVTNTANGVISFFSNLNGTLTSIQVNGAYMVQYNGASYGPENITINTVESAPAEGDPLTVTSLRFFYGVSSSINIDYDDGSFDIRAREMSIEMTSTEDITISSGDDVTIQAGGDDLRLRSWDDTTFTAGYGTDNAYEWRMNNTGRFELPASGYIENPDNASSDGNNFDTLHLVPDLNGISGGNNQYLIIEPTGPNHIHVRAGGTIDQSSADLLLGGERNKVQISDTNRNVGISTRPTLIANTYTNLDTMASASFAVSSSADIQVGYTVNVGGIDYTVTAIDPFEEGVVVVSAGGAIFDGSGSYTFRYEPTYDNQWTFASNGTLYGPAMGSLPVSNILNDNGSNLSVTAANAALSLNGQDVNINADDDVSITANGAMTIEAAGGDMNFYMDGGMYIGPTDSGNQIIKRSDLDNIATTFGYGSFHDQLQQGPFAANSIQAMQLRSTDLSNDVTITGTNSSQITFGRTGKFNIAFSAQLHQLNGSGIVNIWLNKNGTPVPWTNTRVSITANNPFNVAAWNFFVDAAQNDFYEIMWSSNSDNTAIETFAATGSGATLHPEVPSVIATVNQVG